MRMIKTVIPYLIVLSPAPFFLYHLGPYDGGAAIMALCVYVGFVAYFARDDMLLEMGLTWDDFKRMKDVVSKMPR